MPYGTSGRIFVHPHLRVRDSYSAKLEFAKSGSRCDRNVRKKILVYCCQLSMRATSGPCARKTLAFDLYC